MLKVAADRAQPSLVELEPTEPCLAFWRNRWLESIPGTVSWIVLLGPIWATILHPMLGIAFVSLFVLIFLFKAGSWGIRALVTRHKMTAALEVDWLAKLQECPDWERYRVIFLVRAFREGNLKMLAESVQSIYDSSWPKCGDLMERVEVVYATEETDCITQPLVDLLSKLFAGRLPIRQIVHPREPNVLPGPSSAMHYVGRCLYKEAVRNGEDPRDILVVDLDSDTTFHPSYLPCLVYRFASDPNRQQRLYQPIVLFTSGYWQAPLHSRLSALGSSVQTLGWNDRPEVAFTGAAGSLSLYRSVDFWPTTSHSQDSGVELKLRLRYGRDFDVVGLPIPVSVFPVMEVGPKTTTSERVRTYFKSAWALFRQSARWREGPLDEFVEAVRYGSAYFAALKLWRGVERDTLTIMPGYGILVVPLIAWLFHGISISQLDTIGSIAFTITSLTGLVVFLIVLSTSTIAPSARIERRLVEMLLFWIVFPVYIPIVSGVAGLKTSTAYLLGKRPNGHYSPTPK